MVMWSGDETMAPRQSVSEPEAELDLALAAELQAALLPGPAPCDCPHQEIAALNRMCGNVGGDFYDFTRINEDQIALVIGDVVGHGVRASLVMAKIMGWLRSDPVACSRPRQMISALNRMLLDLGDRIGTIVPCSMFHCVVDAPSGTSFFVTAGHPSPLLCDRNKCATLPLGPRNMLLGVEEFDPKEGCHTFGPGERMILYTDGICDAFDPEGEQFGNARLSEVVHQSLDSPPRECARSIFQAVEDFRRDARQTDDETIVVVDRV